MHNLNKAIIEKIQFWSNADIVNHWVGDVVTEKAQHGSQINALQKFWQAILDDKELKKLYLLQKILVILTFYDQVDIVRDTNDLQAVTQTLDPALRNHLKLNLLQAFPQARDVRALLKNISKSESFREYWAQVFDLITLIVLLDASMQSDLLLNTVDSRTNEHDSLIKYAKMLRRISDYFDTLGVAEEHDVMDDIALISALLRAVTPDEDLCAQFAIDVEAIENNPEQRMRLVFSSIQQAYSKMGDYFPDYRVLGDGYRINNELCQAVQTHQDVVKSRLITFNGNDTTSFGFLKTFWSRLGAPVDRDKQLKDEYDFLNRILFLNQQGCLNLKILAQTKSKYASMFLHFDPKTKAFYVNIKENLSNQLTTRAKASKNVPAISLSPASPLMQSLQQQSKARVIQAPPVVKKTPPPSPSIVALTLSLTTDGDDEESIVVPLVAKDAEQLYGTTPDKLDQHIHSHACGNAQKHYLVDWMYTHLLQGTLELNQLETEARSLCCVYWKYNTRDYFKRQSKVYAIEHQVRECAQEELAILAGSEGSVQAQLARERHNSIRASASKIQ